MTARRRAVRRYRLARVQLNTADAGGADDAARAAAPPLRLTPPARARRARTIQGMEQSGPSFGARIRGRPRPRGRRLVPAEGRHQRSSPGIAWIVAVIVAIVGVLWAVRTLPEMAGGAFVVIALSFGAGRRHRRDG